MPGKWNIPMKKHGTLTLKEAADVAHRYSREIEHSDDNLNALEDWLFGMYAPEGCMLEEE